MLNVICQLFLACHKVMKLAFVNCENHKTYEFVSGRLMISL